MAVGVKLMHIVSDSSPQVCYVAATKLYRFLAHLFVLGKRFYC